MTAFIVMALCVVFALRAADRGDGLKTAVWLTFYAVVAFTDTARQIAGLS